MHFAFPPRKSSNPPPYAARSSRSPFLRRSKAQSLALLALGAIAFIWLLSKLFGGSSSNYIPPGTPRAVVITTIDPKLSESYKEAIIANRRHYASRHGYVAFFPNTTDYPLDGAPQSWSTIPALRHAMTLYPHTPYLFYLTSTALIMNPSISLDTHIMEPRRLESLMIVDKPVVPPDSVIKTFPHLKGERIDFVLSQDKEGLAGGSMIVRSGDWAKYFLDAWFDPLYRSYNFQKAEGHALEHIVQWHGTILAKLALVPQRILNSYTTGPADGTYQEGDFVANFHGCQRDSARDCEQEMQPLLTRWREIRDRERR
ncbi:putative alpha-1,6-mannosyltransferase mnn11 [Zalaria obscura]|uniref:Alpha-1,6-mannosyltransferase mnn11 n=1 Tax=Zalaria obscura TaxID=2024903 RepID=A0ACC3S6J6_9PEZI